MTDTNDACGDGVGLHTPGLWITGLGSAYPPHIVGPDKLEDFVHRFYDGEKPSLKKLLQVTRNTGIDTRASIQDFETGLCCQEEPPSIKDMDDFFRDQGVGLAVEACNRAVKEWGGHLSDITHSIGVTCTSYGLPSYDVFVAEKLGLSQNVERVLLAGVGCAGGLAIMRVAAQLACGATARGKPARILAYACELCTPNARHDCAEAEACANPDDVNIAAALFSDGAAAFVLTNDHGLDGRNPILQLHEWGNTTLPRTAQHMQFNPDSMGYTSVLSREIPSLFKDEIKPLFDKLVDSVKGTLTRSSMDVAEFDWAMHPGGKAIINGARKSLGLTDEQLRATNEIYKTRGNSSSPSVLIVLDLLRQMGHGRDDIVAVSFGPGLVLEMALLTLYRAEEHI